jgi:hypothetical protein
VLNIIRVAVKLSRRKKLKTIFKKRMKKVKKEKK